MNELQDNTAVTASTPSRGASRPRLFAMASALSLAAAVSLLACSAPQIDNRTPIGEAFPTVEGESLDGEQIQLPAEVAGGPAILLLGYDQDAQFDADRWLFGILQAETPVSILEVPTIPGLVPSWLNNKIDSGMRAGIPSEDWASVVTVYGDDAKRLVEFTGSREPRNMRVLLLDGSGTVRWIHDRGFSAGVLLELDSLARTLE